jgi:hypothetical protein
MFNCKKITLSFLILFILLAPLAHAKYGQDYKDNKAYAFGAESDFQYRNMWHGISQHKGFIIQPSTWLSTNGITFELNNNVVLYDSNAQEGLEEIEAALSYQYEWQYIVMRAGYFQYFYPLSSGGPTTGEVHFYASYSLFDELTIFTEHFIDVLEYGGAYFGEAGFMYSAELAKKAELDIYSKVGWGNSKFNSTYIGPSVSSLNVLETGISVTIRPLEYLYVTGHAEIALTLDSALKNSLASDYPLNFGIASGVEF